MLRPCSAAVGPVLSTILVVPVCYGPSMAVGSSNYIEIGQSSNWLRTDRGTSLNVGASTQGRSRCHGSSAAVARGTCNRCDQKTRRSGLAADCRLRLGHSGPLTLDEDDVTRVTHAKVFKRTKKFLGIKSVRNGFGDGGEWLWRWRRYRGRLPAT